MLKIDRQTIIEQELAKNGSVLISTLGGLLNCSEETIRRDLKELEAGGKLTRTHGGAYLMEKYDKSYPTKLRKVLYPEIKTQLARHALQYINENDVIMLDSSTTCLTLAEAILDQQINVTIITNSLLICSLCNEQASNINLICLGGSFRRRTSSFTGFHTTAALDRYCADKAFLSCPKVTLERGMSDNHLNESLVREAMLAHAQQKILLMDHTKFGPDTNILFGDLKQIDAIITDDRLSPDWEQFCTQNHIRIDYCDTVAAAAPAPEAQEEPAPPEPKPARHSRAKS